MNAHLSKLIGLAGICLVLAGCAQTGPPLPPSLELPKPPSDLRATRKGNSVTLIWSEPRLTTDRQTVRYIGPTMVCRNAGSEMTTCGNAIEILPPTVADLQKSSKKSRHDSADKRPVPESYKDVLPPGALSEDAEAEVTYAVEVLNRNARGAGLSNLIHVPAISTLPPPNDLSATLSDDGVTLAWTSGGEPHSTPGVTYRYRIYRHAENAGNDAPGGDSSGGKTSRVRDKDAIAGEVPVGGPGPAHFVDAIEWEKTYLYRITAVSIITRAGSEVQVEGEDSPIVRVVAHDIFPPAVPAGLQAAYSGEGQKPFIDLIWAPATSADLAGYNVYRREGDGAAIKLNSDPVKSPSYRDSAVDLGKTYVYSVSSVDVRGNESAKSEETSETVPAKD